MILSRLKQETSRQHRRAEVSLDLMRADLSRAQYAATLRQFYGFIRPWEAAAATLLAPLTPTLGDRNKSPWLAADLRQLGYSDAAIDAAPRCDALPPLHEQPELLGSMYVLEGATLGGQYIARHIRTALGIEAASGGRFFASYGADTPARWQQFRTCLTDLATPGTEDRIVASAQCTFDALHHWFIRTEAAA